MAFAVPDIFEIIYSNSPYSILSVVTKELSIKEWVDAVSHMIPSYLLIRLLCH